MRLRPGCVVAAATVVVVVQACSSTPTSGHPIQPPSGEQSTFDGPARPVDVRLELDQTAAKAGSELRGVLVIDNRTLKPIKTACGFKFAVGITSEQVPFHPAFTLECAINQSVPSGVTRYPITILTTYGSCSQSGQPDGTTPGCLPGPMGAGSRFTVPPPLPAGVYGTAVVINGLPLGDVRLPAPLTVTLA